MESLYINVYKSVKITENRQKTREGGWRLRLHDNRSIKVLLWKLLLPGHDYNQWTSCQLHLHQTVWNICDWMIRKNEYVDDVAC